ncbi:TPA: hypothetical protein I7235_01520 [Vibrio vulnificus]|nr:hypothetical protein [Vibrio vulnificus]HDY7590599.1 hypothetical protein [Vibrio vulnificus]HDY7702256.1 hypothetical protein [Vibrio vulnificus]
MSAGEIGGGGFSYLKPVDFLGQSFQLRKNVPTWEATIGQFEKLIELEGLHLIRSLSCSISVQIAATLKVEFDDVIKEISQPSGGSGFNNINLIGSSGSIDELPIKKLRVWVRYDGASSGASEHTLYSINTSIRYLPAVVETA